MIATESSPTKGGLPVTISYNMAPKEYKSALAVTSPPHGLFGRHIGNGPHHHAVLGQSREVQGYCQAEVAYLGRTISAHPDTTRFDAGG